ncbi:MAG: hypothetical protein U9R74_00825, partial [Pseudomonadota bacterium]|nr:hypothetical protein [Pseudomonadota bacterium]
ESTLEWDKGEDDEEDYFFDDSSLSVNPASGLPMVDKFFDSAGRLPVPIVPLRRLARAIETPRPKRPFTSQEPVVALLALLADLVEPVIDPKGAWDFQGYTRGIPGETRLLAGKKVFGMIQATWGTSRDLPMALVNDRQTCTRFERDGAG